MWKLIVVAGAVVAGTAAAQQPPAKPKPAQVPAAEHALYGTITSLDLKTNVLTVAPMQGAAVTFTVNPRTSHVRGTGLGATPLQTLAKRTGAGIVVHYAGQPGEMRAIEIDFIGHEPVKMAAGTLVRVNKATHLIVIKTAAGPEETFQFLPGAPIEMASGLVSLDVLASKLNQEVSLYYTESGTTKRVRLVTAGTPATS